MLGVAGCRAPLPVHPWKGADAAVRLMAERDSRIRTVQSAARVVLNDADAGSVTLDAAVVAAPPDQFRIRAWKLGHAVFDITVTSEGVWVKADEMQGRPANAAIMPSEAFDAGSLAEAWRMFTGRAFVNPDGKVEPGVDFVDRGGPEFSLSRVVSDRGNSRNTEPLRIVCDVDRATFTARRYRMFAGERDVGTLTLADYQSVDGIVFPRRLTASTGQGTVEIVLDDPEFNLSLAPEAFMPPAAARRRE